MEILNKRHFYHKSFIIFGHRGVPELYPENTLQSFESAIDLKYDAIELDVMQTKDQKIIVNHDLILQLNNEEREVQKINYKEIKNTFPSIKTLEEILISIGHKTNINIEIKCQNKNSLYIAEKVIKILKDFDLIDNIIISSFNPWIIKHIKKIDDRFITAWIWGKDNFYFFLSWPIVLKYFKANAIHINQHQISSKLIKKIKSNQMKVLAYTVNNPKILLNLISKNIDGVFTDSPSILKLSRNTNLQNYQPK